MSDKTRKNMLLGWAVFLGALIVVFILGLLVAKISERRAEVAGMAIVLHPLDPMEPDNEKFKDNYPNQYDSWKMTELSEGETKYGGPTQHDWLEIYPEQRKLFAGYAFSIDYKDDRGHAMALFDVVNTGRHKRNPPPGGKDFPATCWTCKSPNVPVLMEEMGLDNFYSAKFWDLEDKIKHSIGCADCHDGETMNLRISRPALREAFKAMGKDIDNATHQEMRTLVCAQCHVEYYFAGDKQHLTHPWEKGTTAEAMVEYYNERDFSDWEHKISKTPMVKMQHPDYEVYLTGVHAYRGVACADCHMPYTTIGGVKYSDHHVQSPLKNIANSCAVCHRWSEEEVRTRVESIQDKTAELLGSAGAALTSAHEEVAVAMVDGFTDEDLIPVRALIRDGQMYWDYVAANNGFGFHSPQECARVLGKALDLAQQARLELKNIRIEKLKGE